MLDAKIVRANPEEIAQLLKKKGYEFPVAQFTELENQRKQLQVDTENLLAGGVRSCLDAFLDTANDPICR